MTNHTVHHDKMGKHGKQIISAGIATATLISGTGATNEVLADTLGADKTELVEKHTKATKSTQSASDTTSPVLQKPTDFPTSAIDRTQAATPKYTIDNSLAKNIGAKATAKKQRQTRVGTQPYIFTASDFNLSADKTTITGFSADFIDAIDLETWDGVLAFPAELNSTVTAIARCSFAAAKVRDNENWNGREYESNDYLLEIAASITAVDFRNLTNLERIGDEAFFGTVTYDDELHQYAQNSKLTSINLTGLNKLKKIERFTFATTNIASIDFSQVPNLEVLDSGAFAFTPVTEVDLSPLTKLKSIETQIFGYCTNLQSVKLPESDIITSIGVGAFMQTALASIDLSPLKNLILIDQYAFEETQLSSVDLSSLSKLETIGEEAFSYCPNLTTVLFPNSSVFTTIGVQAFTMSPLIELDFTLAPNLINIGELAFNYVNWNGIDLPDDGPSKIRKITVGKPDDGLILNIDPTAFMNLQGAGTVVAANNDALANARGFADAINNGETKLNPEYASYRDPMYIPFTGDELWRIPATITYKYVDQHGLEITKDLNGQPLPTIAENSWIDNGYTVAAAPVITGYTAPTLIEGAASGTVDLPYKTIVYQYQRNDAQPFSIYWVDTDGKVLDSKDFADYPEEGLDLSPMDIDGYDFQELFGSSKPAVTRALTDYTWEAHPELVGQKISYEDHGGRSYKFVYAKKATEKPTTNDTTDKPETTNQPATDDTDKTPTPGNSNKPIIEGNIDPEILPATGGDEKQNPTTNTGNVVDTSTGTTTNTTVNSNNTKAGNERDLPQSGKYTNLVLPALGLLAVAGAFGLAMLSKKRKS